MARRRASPRDLVPCALAGRADGVGGSEDSTARKAAVASTRSGEGHGGSSGDLLGAPPRARPSPSPHRLPAPGGFDVPRFRTRTPPTPLRPPRQARRFGGGTHLGAAAGGARDEREANTPLPSQPSRLPSRRRCVRPWDSLFGCAAVPHLRRKGAPAARDSPARAHPRGRVTARYR